MLSLRMDHLTQHGVRLPEANPAVTGNDDARPWLSVAAPCYNEAEGIADVVAEWNAVLDTVPQATEIVLCNDGSTDGTAAVLAELTARYPRLGW